MGIFSFLSTDKKLPTILRSQRYKHTKYFISVGVVFFLLVSFAAAFYLSRQKADIRQQAYVAEGGDNSPNDRSGIRISTNSQGQQTYTSIGSQGQVTSQPQTAQQFFNQQAPPPPAPAQQGCGPCGCGGCSPSNSNAAQPASDQSGVQEINAEKAYRRAVASGNASQALTALKKIDPTATTQDLPVALGGTVTPQGTFTTQSTSSNGGNAASNNNNSSSNSTSKSQTTLACFNPCYASLHDAEACALRCTNQSDKPIIKSFNANVVDPNSLQAAVTQANEVAITKSCFDACIVNGDSGQCVKSCSSTALAQASQQKGGAGGTSNVYDCTSCMSFYHDPSACLTYCAPPASLSPQPSPLPSTSPVHDCASCMSIYHGGIECATYCPASSSQPNICISNGCLDANHTCCGAFSHDPTCISGKRCGGPALPQPTQIALTNGTALNPGDACGDNCAACPYGFNDLEQTCSQPGGKYNPGEFCGRSCLGNCLYGYNTTTQICNAVPGQYSFNPGVSCGQSCVGNCPYGYNKDTNTCLFAPGGSCGSKQNCEALCQFGYDANGNCLTKAISHMSGCGTDPVSCLHSCQYGFDLDAAHPGSYICKNPSQQSVAPVQLADCTSTCQNQTGCTCKQGRGLCNNATVAYGQTCGGIQNTQLAMPQTAFDFYSALYGSKKVEQWNDAIRDQNIGPTYVGPFQVSTGYVSSVCEHDSAGNCIQESAKFVAGPITAGAAVAGGIAAAPVVGELASNATWGATNAYLQGTTAVSNVVGGVTTAVSNTAVGGSLIDVASTVGNATIATVPTATVTVPVVGTTFILGGQTITVGGAAAFGGATVISAALAKTQFESGVPAQLQINAANDFSEGVSTLKQAQSLTTDEVVTEEFVPKIPGIVAPALDTAGNASQLLCNSSPVSSVVLSANPFIGAATAAGPAIQQAQLPWCNH